MDAAEFAKLGAELVEKGQKLQELKEARDDLNREIAEIEKQLRPLVTQHAKFVAELVGQPTVNPVPSPKLTPVDTSGGVTAELRQKIISYANRHADPENGLSAAEIAEGLKIDPAIVRQVLNDLARRRA
jgi:hypothetical protein